MGESILMLYAKNTAMVLAVMFFALALNASAQWSPGGSMVYMGDLNLAASSASSGKAVQALGGSQEILAATNNSSLNSSLINGTSMDNTTIVQPINCGAFHGCAGIFRQKDSRSIRLFQR